MCLKNLYGELKKKDSAKSQKESNHNIQLYQQFSMFNISFYTELVEHGTTNNAANYRESATLKNAYG